MGIADRDYMRKRKVHWDNSRSPGSRGNKKLFGRRSARWATPGRALAIVFLVAVACLGAGAWLY
jgi:hypothetical protein